MPTSTPKSQLTKTPSKRYKIGIRLPDWISGYRFRIFEGLLDFQRSGHEIDLFFDQPSGGDLPPAPIDKHWKGDGLLVYRYTTQEAKAWSAANIPVVNLSAEFPGKSSEFPRVTMDNQKLGEMAFEHLSLLGLRDFAYIHEPTRVYSDERLASFKKAVLAAGCTFHQIDVAASAFPIPERPEKIDDCLREPLRNLPIPCGILAKDDFAAVYTIRMIQKLGMNCPNQFPLLGITDDIVFCNGSQPPISSITYPGKKAGFLASELLMRMIQGQHISPTTRLLIPPGPLVSRESTRHVILNDEVVTRALSHIRAMVSTQPITVEELSQLVGVSREGLRKRFNATLGRSPKQEIQRLRAHYVTELLRTTDLTLEAIAEKCGFSAADEVCRFIKRITGLTPGEIKKRTKS